MSWLKKYLIHIFTIYERFYWLYYIMIKSFVRFIPLKIPSRWRKVSFLQNSSALTFCTIIKYSYFRKESYDKLSINFKHEKDNKVVTMPSFILEYLLRSNGANITLQPFSLIHTIYFQLSTYLWLIRSGNSKKYDRYSFYTDQIYNLKFIR